MKSSDLPMAVACLQDIQQTFLIGRSSMKCVLSGAQTKKGKKIKCQLILKAAG